MNKEYRKRRWYLIGYAYLILILFALWVTATYTWFSISRTPRVSDMQISITSRTGLELAYRWDSEEWTQHLDLSEIIDEEIDPLKPITWVNEENAFYAANYGLDGRISSVSKLMNDLENANQRNMDGYYLMVSFYAKTGANVSVSLTPATATNDGIDGAGTYVIGTPVWDSENILHNNGGNGAEKTVRVGIKITKLDEYGIEKANSVQFYVYEPNYDGVDTKGLYGGLLVPETQLILQTPSTWSEVYPVQHNVVMKEMGEFLTDVDLFELSPDEFAKIDLYFWMEGQDIDCNHTIGQDAKILANIQFLAEAEGESGIEEF